MNKEQDIFYAIMHYSFDRENRERRIGIDRVKDSVEKRLIEENDTILHYQQLMKELVNQVGLFFDFLAPTFPFLFAIVYFSTGI